MNNKEELREELLGRIESSRKYDWTGGFEPEFLANWFINILSLREQELWDKIQKKKIITPNQAPYFSEGEMDAYNQALSDIIKEIK